MYPPGNVIAVAEKKENYFCIHFLNLRDGSPYCTPPSNAIVCELPPRAGPIIGNRIVITGSRVMMYVYYYDEDPLGDAMVRKILVWDWKTGELVLDLLFTNRTEPVKQNPRAIFLDEFRMALVDRWGIAELAVFNTLVPQGSSGNLRRFGFPPEFRDRHGKIFADCDRDLGTPNRGDAFVPDPTQAVLAVELGRCSEPHLLLVDEWREDAVVMEVPTYGSILPTFVHGAQVVVVGTHIGNQARNCHNVHTFDFGRCGSLPLRGSTGGTERRVLFEDGANFKFKSGDGGWCELRSLSDGSLFCLGMRGDGGGFDGTLQVWEFR